MKKNAHVLIFEKDPFARSMMEMLLVKDWSVHVLGAEGDPKAFQTYTESRRGFSQKPDLVICNAALTGDLATNMLSLRQACPILVVCNQFVDLQLLPEGLDQSIPVVGVLLKDEILFSLGYAVSYAVEGFWVKTPQVPWRVESLFRLPSQSMVTIDGQKLSCALTPSEEKMVRYAIIYSVERRDIADERVLSENSVYTAIYEIYKKLGVDDLFNSQENFQDWIAHDPVLAKPFLRMKSVLEASTGSSKTLRESLAYHTYAMPLVSEDIR